MKTGPAGIELIQRNEGLELTAYLDRLAKPPVWTIGWGHTGAEVVPGLTITRQQADEWFAERLAREFEPGVMRAIGDALTTQAQFDAMVSLAYNIGVGAFAKSSVARLHKAGDYEGAADAFLAWNKAGGRVLAGLVRRRAEERALYLSEESAPAVPAYTRADAARDMQTALAKLGLYRARVDGDWGKLSREAYDEFLKGER